MKTNSQPMTVAETVGLLERIRDQQLSLPLVAEDDETIGSKRTACSWGLCTDDPEIITKDLRTWPDRELVNGHVYGVRPRHVCHFDKTDRRGKGASLGCFYRCRVFQDGLNSADEARKLIDLRIAELRAS